ncbi:sensor histidine kinase [Aldersonia kunmingensis]|uniref:sensor histidine kinase n=1 Tax=Aldersonia kunmingensis TaxID=408066 RepID=UPI00082D1C72|nr:ATP-binding protein [Aldersonia kunmingensis]
MTTTVIGPRRGGGIGLRLMLAQATVLIVGAVTASLVALVVGPPLFRDHLHMAGVSADSAEQHHAEEAFRSATAISVGVAIVAAALAALGVAWYLSRRLQRSVSEVAAAATAVADGDYDIRVSPPQLGAEFDSLAEGFNRMADRLGSVEATRRRMLSDLAHEIRTPVAVLEASFEAIEDGVKRLDPATIEMLRDQTRRLVRFSADLATLTVAEEGQAAIEPVAVQPEALIRTALAAASDRYDADGISLESDLPDSLPALWGDPQRLGQVLGNLLDNAVRHTPTPGRIVVRASADQNELTIEVADTGEGIAAEHLPHVFERFYRVDTARDRGHGGSGIGLAISKAIIDAHGGRITAHSDGPGTGTTFAITLRLRP